MIKTCKQCGKKGLFLKLDRNDLCPQCIEKNEAQKQLLLRECMSILVLEITDKFKRAVSLSAYQEVLTLIKSLTQTQKKLFSEIILSNSTEENLCYSHPVFGLFWKHDLASGKTAYEICLNAIQKEYHNYPKLPTYKYDFKYESEIFNVVGVTFKNGRKSRQAILRRIRFKDPPYNRVNFELKQYEFEGAPAYGVFANGEQLGNIAKRDIDKISYRWDRYKDIEAYDVHGGGITSSGEARNYGIDIRVRFNKEQ